MGPVLAAGRRCNSGLMEVTVAPRGSTLPTHTPDRPRIAVPSRWIIGFEEGIWHGIWRAVRRSPDAPAARVERSSVCSWSSDWRRRSAPCPGSHSLRQRLVGVIIYHPPCSSSFHRDDWPASGLRLLRLARVQRGGGDAVNVHVWEHLVALIHGPCADRWEREGAPQLVARRP